MQYLWLFLIFLPSSVPYKYRINCPMKAHSLNQQRKQFFNTCILKKFPIIHTLLFSEDTRAYHYCI